MKYAESFGAKGFRATSQSEFVQLFQAALQEESPVIIDVPVDYKDSSILGETILPDEFY